ncbi:MAG: hypothetical protein HYX97_00015 [Chloroflexi bacterium]|nr:hypothetical protein [Chloroflexota bacterium]
MTSHDDVVRTFHTLSRQQLEIYAKELQARIVEERRLRQELAEQTGQLEQRLREITALNQMFQKHLGQQFEVIDTYRQLLDGLRRLAHDATALREQADKAPLPDTHNAPGLEQGKGH